MAKWEIKEEPREGGIIRIRLFRDGNWVGGASGVITKPDVGPKYFGVTRIWVKAEYQREYMKAHKGLKMGDVLGANLLKLLKKNGISYIHPGEQSPYGARFVERGIGSGILEKTPRKGFLKINFEKLPATEEAKTRMIRELRAREAAKKPRGIPRKPRRTRPR